MASTTKTDILDHIVHLTPPGSVQEVSSQFRDLGFTVVPGGTHADKLTANALVVLADGIYLELISFTHPASHYPPGSPSREKRESNPWAHKSPGWIDFAFLGNGSVTTSISSIINERAAKEGSGIVYLPEVSGGRTRTDGETLKWLISSPPSDKRGVLPFFCGDITPRHLRVPSEPSSNTEHASTAQGISHVMVLSDHDSLEVIAKQISSVVGKPPSSSAEFRYSWKLESEHKGKSAPQLILKSPQDSAEVNFIKENGTGIYEVGFRVKAGHEDGSRATPYGKITWIPEE